MTVEGHLVGQLAGFHFEPERGATALENRRYQRGRAGRRPEVARRLGALASEGDEAFALAPGGVVNWRGEAAGEIIGGEPFAPRVRLIGEFGAEPQRERAARRLEAFGAAEATRRLYALKHLKEAIEDGRLRGLARGLAYQLVEQFGALDRRAADARIKLLSRNERRTLKALGVRFGAFSLYLPRFSNRRRSGSRWPMPNSQAPRGARTRGAQSAAPSHPTPEALSLRGLRPVGQLAAPIAELERLDALARAAWPEGRAASTPPTRCLRILAGGATTRITSFARLVCPRAGRRRRRARLVSPARPPPDEPPKAPRRDPVCRACGAHEAGGAANAPPQAQARPDRRTRRLVTEDACRIDVWLWRARFFKTRSLAARIVEEGGMRLVRGQSRMPVDKPSRPVRCGDVLTFAQGPRWVAVKVEALGERRGPATEARALYSMLTDAAARRLARTSGNGHRWAEAHGERAARSCKRTLRRADERR